MLARSNLTERETENTAYAAFGQADYNLREDLILTLGLRYTQGRTAKPTTVSSGATAQYRQWRLPG